MKETIFRRHSLGDLEDPWLRQSLRAWYRISDAKGRFQLGQDLRPLLYNPELLLPTSILFRVDGSGARDFVILRQGPQARQGLGKNLTGCRLGEYADTAYIEAAGSELVRAAVRGEVVYDEILAPIAGRLFHYDRLIFPVMWRGNVDQLLTVARWRSPALH